MARNGGIAEDLFGSKEPKKTTGGMGLIEDTEKPLDEDDTDPVDEEEQRRRKALGRKKRLLGAAVKWAKPESEKHKKLLKAAAKW